MQTEVNLTATDDCNSEFFFFFFFPAEVLRPPRLLEG